MNRSRSNPPEPPLSMAAFHEAMAPLVRNCRDDNFTPERAADYYALLKWVPPRLLRAAVVTFLSESDEPWFPMPRVLRDLARKARDAETARLVATAPDCEVCESSGLVSARPHGSQGYAGFACNACVRGRQYRGHAKYDPQTMDSFKDQARRLAAENPPPKRLEVSELVNRVGNVPMRIQGAGG